MQRILKISRPRFWIYVIGPFILSIAATYGVYEIPWIPVAILFLYFSFPANIFIYGVNDLYDRDTDMLNEKKKEYEKILDTKDDTLLKKIILITNIPFLIYICFSVHYVVFFVFILFIFFSWQYSARPIRAKAVPFLDSIFSSFLYILPGILSHTLITHTIPGYIPMIAGFLWSYAMHVYSAVPDITADTNAGIQTGATILGKNATLILCGMLYAVSGILAIPYIGVFGYVAIAVYLYMIIISIKKKEPDGVLSIYKYFPLLNTIIGGTIFFILIYKNIY